MGQFSRIYSFSSQAFSAGASAAFLTCILVWFAGAVGITDSYGISIKPKLEMLWLYPYIIHGGLWALIYNFPFLQKATVIRGIILSFIPCSFHLFVLYPVFFNEGIMGTRLGDYTPFFIIIAYAIWGVLTSVFLRHSGGRCG